MQNITPAHLRLAAYVVAVVAGIAMVVTGAIEADSLHGWVGETSTTLGAALAALGGLAGLNIDRTGTPPTVDVADLPTVREAVADVIDDLNTHATEARATFEKAAADADRAKHRLEDRINVTTQEPADPRKLLDAMRARVDAARGGEPAPGRHRTEG